MERFFFYASNFSPVFELGGGVVCFSRSSGFGAMSHEKTPQYLGVAMWMSTVMPSKKESQFYSCAQTLQCPRNVLVVPYSLKIIEANRLVYLNFPVDT
ncbi:hypothetical protein TNCV_4499231 [Trichonephila clavipes]|nr:hypothetical protein TNCV_4499231 [Trichonephila clavipes]